MITKLRLAPSVLIAKGIQSSYSLFYKSIRTYGKIENTQQLPSTCLGARNTEYLGPQCNFGMVMPVHFFVSKKNRDRSIF